MFVGVPVFTRHGFRFPLARFPVFTGQQRDRGRPVTVSSLRAELAPAEALAHRTGKCRLCHQPIVAGADYIARLERIGWVHALCAKGYRDAIAENEEAAS